MDWKTFDWKTQLPWQKGKVLNKTIYKCAFCKGKGFIPSKRNASCLVCSANGVVSIAAPAVICAYCNGEGRSYLNRELTCIICEGKGIVGVETNDIEICSTCRGKGRERGSSLPCIICKGKGVIVKK